MLFLAPLAAADVTGLEDVVINHFPNTGLYIEATQSGYPATMNKLYIEPFTGSFLVGESLKNQTDLVWTDYHIDIQMHAEFQISGVISPMDWTWEVSEPQVLDDNLWHGRIDYYAGTPINIGQTMSLGFYVSGPAVGTEFTLNQVPSGESIVVPAPGALLLAGLGTTCLTWMRRRNIF